MDEHIHEQHHLEFEALKSDLHHLVVNEQHEHEEWWPKIREDVARIDGKLTIVLWALAALASAIASAAVATVLL